MKLKHDPPLQSLLQSQLIPIIPLDILLLEIRVRQRAHNDPESKTVS